MVEQPYLANFYVIKHGDPSGETARGPYTMTQAESAVQDDELIITQERLATMRGQPGTAEPDTNPLQAVMLRETRSWGLTLLLLGVLHIATAGFLNATWGILLIVVGLASFYFRSAAIFVVYGVTLGWAGLSNFLGGQGGWTAFALFQFFLTFRVFQQFFRFRNQSAWTGEAAVAAQRSTKIFPPAGCLLGGVSLVGFVVVIASVFVAVGVGATDVPGFVGFVEGITVIMGVLGFSLGLATLLCGYPQKIWAALGMVAGGLVLLAEVGFSFLG